MMNNAPVLYSCNTCAWFWYQSNIGLTLKSLKVFPPLQFSGRHCVELVFLPCK